MMNGDTFFGMMRNIYAVFNKPVPSDSSPFVMSVWERVNHVPDEAVPYIVNQIADEERMPQNVGRAILRAWESWQTNNPGRMVHIHCDVCGGDGFFWCWKQDEKTGKYQHFLSPCPACRKADYPLPSMRELRERGVVVMPVGYAGGPVQFDRDSELGALWPVGTPEGCGKRFLSATEGEGKRDMRLDPLRLRAMSEAERADVVGARYA